MSPRSLSWAIGEAPSTKQIKITAHPEFPVKVLAVFSDIINIQAKLQVKKDGEEYTILVTPANTAVELRSSISIITDYHPDGKNRIFTASAAVQASDGALPGPNPQSMELR